MDINILNEYLKQRLELSDKYKEYNGRHIFFNKYLPLLEKGIELTTQKELRDNELNETELEELYDLGKQFIQIRDLELKSHESRFNTVIGNDIHNIEYNLYSMALDVFQTYGTSN